VGKSGLKEEVHISLEEEDTSLFLSAQTFYMSAPLKCPSHQHLLPEDAFLFLN
jgi:hypothetical protein